MISRLLRQLGGSALIAAHLVRDRGAPFLSRERLEARRDRRIRGIVRYAARRVPYYRDWFAREGIDPRSIAGAAELDRLPLLDRTLVRAKPELFVAETRAGRDGLRFVTSGTTGTPFEIRHDRRSLLANIAWGERERTPVNRVCGGAFRPKELYVGYETSTFKKVIAFYENATLFPVRPRRQFVSLLEPVESVAARLDAERPDLLVGYGGWIDQFFRAVVARGLAPHRPRAVLYMGEALPPGTRDLVEGELGIPLLSRYNAVESFKIGFTCEAREGFHVHEDLCHLRIAAPDGGDVAAGVTGQVVVSNLVNRATVLLNYPLGDVAALFESPCDCGRIFRRLSELEGRVEDVLPLADGRFVHPRAVWQALKDVLGARSEGDEVSGILQYRLVQHEPRRFELELASVDDDSFRRASEGALPRLAALLGPDAEVRATRLDQLERPGGGKFRAVVSRAPRSVRS